MKNRKHTPEQIICKLGAGVQSCDLAKAFCFGIEPVENPDRAPVASVGDVTELGIVEWLPLSPFPEQSTLCEIISPAAESHHSSSVCTPARTSELSVAMKKSSVLAS
ncbi:MAG TPA: hypothetical protein VNV87_15740 [Acidimicrobiales bacterium]|nr:hypothetical protein [Acidimicrobiales bacterium]